MRKLPLWVRAILRADRLAWYAYRCEELVRDELLRGWLEPDLRHVVIDQAYARQTGYLPGGNTYEKGLFDWEEKALAAAPFPKEGRVLLGAAGGGRELRALCERGLQVLAFEPNETLRAGAEAIARQSPRCQVVAAAYQDLVTAATARTGPLAAALDGSPFDAAILGWGSFTHVLSRVEHVALLEAVRTFAPNGPVLISFFVRAENAAKGRADRLRDALRSMFSALGGRTAPEGLAYEMNGGFVYYFTAAEIHEIAFAAGYEVVHLDASPFPHAILLPLGATRG